jgi:hypothetical protein
MLAFAAQYIRIRSHNERVVDHAAGRFHVGDIVFVDMTDLPGFPDFQFCRLRAKLIEPGLVQLIDLEGEEKVAVDMKRVSRLTPYANIVRSTGERVRVRCVIDGVVGWWDAEIAGARKSTRAPAGYTVRWRGQYCTHANLTWVLQSEEVDATIWVYRDNKPHAIFSHRAWKQLRRDKKNECIGENGVVVKKRTVVTRHVQKKK